MWKYGYLITQCDPETIGPCMVSLSFDISMDRMDLFRKAQGCAEMTVYKYDGKKRDILQMCYISRGTRYEHEHIMVEPGVKLMVAFSQIKKKCNSFVASSIMVRKHSTDKLLQDKDEMFFIAKSSKPQPLDVFNHRWK